MLSSITKWQVAAAIVAIPILMYANLVRKVRRNISLIKEYNPTKKLKIYAFYLPMMELFYRLDLLPDFLNPLPSSQWRTDPRVEGIYDDDGVAFLISSEMITMRVKNEKLIHEIYERKGDFGKPIHLYKVLDVFGRNVVTTEGADWKKHRKITAPQFSEKNNALVFEVTKKSILELIEIWKSVGFDKKVDVLNEMFQLAMHVISGAAFGVQLNFREDVTDVKDGHTITFKQSLQHLATALPIYIALPNWLVRVLPFQNIKDAKRDIDEFDAYMHELYQSAYDGKLKGNNLLNALVQSMKSEENVLTIRELLGNMFIFLFAGHETTANALTYALASLALNPTIQERLLQEIQLVLNDDEEFRYSKLNQMPYTLVHLVN
jgi:cytochrome P450